MQTDAMPPELHIKQLPSEAGAGGKTVDTICPLALQTEVDPDEVLRWHLPLPPPFPWEQTLHWPRQSKNY